MTVISDHGVDLSIFEKCHHNIIFRKIDIRTPLPPSYVRKVKDYRKVNAKSIQKATRTFGLVKAFENISIDGKVDILNESLMNYFPSQKVKCNYCQAIWVNDKMKKGLIKRSKLTKFYYKHDQKVDQNKLQAKAACCILDQKVKTKI